MDLLPLDSIDASLLQFEQDEESQGPYDPLYDPAEDSNITTNPKGEKYKCPECNYPARSRGNLRRHRKRIHKEVEKTFACDYCPYRSSKQWNLSSHMKHIHLPKHLKCEYENCKFASNEAKSLERHVNEVHEMEKSITCDYCPYRCTKRFNLASHMRHMHLPKHLKCEYENCNWATNDPKLIQTHVDQVHLEIKNYNCDHCEFRCARKDNLTSHMKHNHMPRNLKCEYKECLFATNIPREIQRHVDQVHLQIKPFSCDQCDYKATCKSNLNGHQSRVHLRALYEDPNFMENESLKINIEEKYNSKNPFQSLAENDGGGIESLSKKSNYMKANSVDIKNEMKVNLKHKTANIPIESEMVQFECPYCKTEYLVNKEILEFVRCKKCYLKKIQASKTQDTEDLQNGD